MTLAAAKSQSRIRGTALLIAIAGVALFQFFGNATRGYVDTASLFWWWISQWIDPQAETEHGWLILGISLWLFWRNLKMSWSSFAAVGDAGSRTLGWTTPAGTPVGERGKYRSARASADARESVATGASSPASALDHSVQSSGSDRTSSGAERRSGPLLVVLVALALHAIGYVAQQSRISIVALLLFTWGVLAMANQRWARAAAFPLGFMLFAVPLNVLDSVGFWLRLAVMDATSVIAQGVGIEVLRSGTQLFAPAGGFQYDVAAACSGVRSLMALAALSLLIGYLNFRSPWKRALMLLLCFPLTYVGNVVRVVAIVVTAHFADQAMGQRVHDVMGYGVFVIVLGGIIAASAHLHQRWPETLPRYTVRNTGSERAVEAPETAARAPWILRRPRLMGFVVIGVMGAEMAFLGYLAHARPPGAAGVWLEPSGFNPVPLPAFLGTDWVGRNAEVSAVERATLPPDTGFSRRSYVSVQDKSHSVFLSIVLSGRDRTSIHRPELCLVGQGWTVLSTADHPFRLDGSEETPLRATVLRTRLVDSTSHRELKAVVAYWFVSADAVVATHWQRFVHDAWNRVVHGRADRWAYVLVQADAADGEKAALGRIQSVLSKTVPAFQAVSDPAGDGRLSFPMRRTGAEPVKKT